MFSVTFESTLGGVRCETDHLILAVAKLNSAPLPVEPKYRRAIPQLRWRRQDRARNLDLYRRNLSRKPYRSAHRHCQPGKLIYAARTRNGFTPASRAELFKKLKPLEIKAFRSCDCNG